jgi:hypothetical protein
MGSLSNLYISQSYISLLHLGSDNTASTTMTELQDGLGNGIGVSVNTQGAISASGISLNNSIVSHRGLEASGTIRFNTSYTSSTPQYVNSGNQFTDNIIRITGSYASGSLSNPTLNEVQNGWIANGPGINNAIVIANDYVPATGWRFTIDQNTAVWFGSYTFTNPQTNYENFSVSGSQDITGSLWIRDTLSVTNISASGNISASNIWVKDKIHAYELDVTIVSSSIVFTSGSNILGDNANEDVQLLIGRTIVTGSLEVTSSIKATSDISSSTLNGIGNVTIFSQSVDLRLDNLENFSSSQYKADSASFQSQITTNSASFAAYSSSLVATFATNAYVNSVSQSLNQFTASQIVSNSYFATTGSNSFIGNQIFSGSVRGAVIPLTISSNTASMDCSLGNFFTLTLPTGSTTFLNPTNIRPGETLSLRITQILNGTLRYPNTVKFPLANAYTASVGFANTTDILTFVSYDTASLFAVATNTLQ